ncbi:DASS family sodium-coupled anion symporter [Reichenbachiella sp. MALMAid0571]|uniref:SLC13 family permease n=1 Tax=Reichenbachiella sp. MALMAid0571 TaxID=3143939 RepID=UPI0032DF383C
MKKLISILSGPLSFIIILLTGPYGGMSPEAHAILASTSWVAIWWITEAIPIAVTSLLPLILFPLSGGLDIKSTASAFGNKMIFLYLGGFVIAIAIEKWNLHKRIALNVIRVIGTDMNKMVLGFMVATGFLSMWISNTATTVMMLPIGMAIVLQLSESEKVNRSTVKKFGKVLMLGIAYSSSIGGISTLIGTPPNLVLAGVVEEFYGVEIAFGSWFILVFPISVVLLFVCWKFLVTFAFPLKDKVLPGGKEEIRERIRDLGRLGFEEKLILAVFLVTAFSWITRSFLLVKILPNIDDSIIAIMGAVVLFILPAKGKKEKRILEWENCKTIPWGIILLFGGGLAIAEGFKSSGLAIWIGNQTTLLNGISLILLLLIIVAMVNFLTEITSNLATTSMILPIIAPIAQIINVHPFILMFGATIAASCAFMLPVATPPNAVVFGSGYLKISDMMRTGFLLNIISIIVIGLYLYFVLPLLWEIDIFNFPMEFK